jgi:hypothetical protein
MVTDAANTILKERLSKRNSKIRTVGKCWTTRFIKSHGYFRRKQKVMDANRKESEDIERTNRYFLRLKEVIDREGIVKEDIYNMDETGFRIGIGSDQLIITKRKKAHYFGIPENRESATAIECISAGGYYLPAFIILSGINHMGHWYQQPELHDDTVLCTTPTGYSNDELSLDWIKHFERHTMARTIGAKRLLILDGHGSHHTIEFIKFCDNHNIIPFGMPPHLTHRLQPLDVVCFQPYKHFHGKENDRLVREGVINITKVEFLSIIEGVRESAFKDSTIESAFRKTGIHPYNPLIVLTPMLEAAPARTPSPGPAGPSSSPFNTLMTLRQINKVAERLEEVLEEDEFLDDDFAHNISKFIKGSLVLATELVQTKRDLGKTRLAQSIQKQRRAMKNTVLQSGGILTVAEGRRMVLQKEVDAVEKARKLVEASDKRERNRIKNIFGDAAKKARAWRTVGKLSPAEIYEENKPMRLLKRF